jgi:hypothetical protein
MGGVIMSLSVNGFAEDRTPTVANGTAILQISDPLPAGKHDLRVTHERLASMDMTPANAHLELEIRPGTIDVEMVPSLPGVEVVLTRLDGAGGDPQPGTTAAHEVSDADGLARFEITEVGTYRVELVLPWTSPDPGMKAEFSRWHDNVFDTWRELEYRQGILLQAGFEVHYLVNYDFTNLQEEPIDPSEVTSITLMNSMGERFTLTSHEPLWVQGGRVTRRAHGLEETQLQYSVDEVIVDGANVINKSQHRFIPAEVRSWTIPLLYYSMTFVSQDALFAFPVGSSVEVVSPNGTTRIAPLDNDGQAFLPLLPRGEYQVRVLDGGYSPPVPVALSRDQAVDLKVITIYDTVFVVGLGGGVALSLLLVGRWKSIVLRWWVRLRHPRSLRPS